MAVPFIATCLFRSVLTAIIVELLAYFGLLKGKEGTDSFVLLYYFIWKTWHFPLIHDVALVSSVEAFLDMERTCTGVAAGVSNAWIIIIGQYMEYN